MAVGGVNIDDLKCELAVVRQERQVAQERVEKLMAAASMLASDLDAAKRAAVQREADLALWFKAQFGEPKTAEAVKP